MKKTKKALLATLVLSASLVGAVGFAACDENKTTEHNHVWSGWTVTQMPTADAKGKATRTCTGEGDCDAEAAEKEFELPALNDVAYEKGADSATCSSAGKIIYAFHVGGVDVSFDVATPVNANAHSFGEYVNDDPEGHYKVCTLNHEHKTEKTPHDENGADGACSVCGHKHQHTWGDWTVNEADKPTATTEGKATRACTVTGCNKVNSDFLTLPALETEGAYTVTDNSATCTQAGTGTYTLNENDAVFFTAATAAKGHGALDHHEAVEASCFKDGVKEHWSCPVCEAKFSDAAGTTETDDVTTPATGEHVYGTAWTQGTDQHYHQCTTAGCTAQKDACNHDTKGMASSGAAFACSVCGKSFGGKMVLVGKPVTATMKLGAGTWQAIHAGATNARGYYEFSYTGSSPMAVYECGKADAPFKVMNSGDKFYVNMMPRQAVFYGVTSDAEELFDATITFKWVSETNPEYILQLDTAKEVTVNGEGAQYSFTAPETGWYDLRWDSDDAFVLVDGSADVTTSLTSPYTFALEQGNKITFSLMGKDETATVTYTVTVASTGHVHTIVHHAANPATCTQEGTLEYWSCSDCSLLFADAEGTRFIKDVVDPAGHNMEKHDGWAATCDVAGRQDYYTCDKCGKMYRDEAGTEEFDDLLEIGIPASHTLTLVEMNASTKTVKYPDNSSLVIKNASMAYYRCSQCNKMFKDEAGEYEVSAVHSSSRRGIFVNFGTNLIESRDKAATYIADGTAVYTFTFDEGVVINQAVYILKGTKTNSTTTVYNANGLVNKDGKYILAEGTQTLANTLTVKMEKGEWITFVVNKTGFTLKVEAEPVLSYGDNMVVITEANGQFVDEYEFVPTETKKYSITVPAGVEVLADNADLVGNGQTSANFEATEGVKIVFAFKNSAAGVITVTIGEAIELPKLTLEGLSNLSLPSKTVSGGVTSGGMAIVEVGDIEEGTYTISVTVPVNLARGGVICFGKNTSTTYTDYFESNGNYVNGVAQAYVQVPMTGTMNGADYTVSVSGYTWNITLSLKKGDKLVFVNGGTTDGTLKIALAQA